MQFVLTVASDYRQSLYCRVLPLAPPTRTWPSQIAAEP